MNLEDLKIYERAMDLGECVWRIVGQWEYFEKQTIGRQWVRAADSVAANISEGFGRYHYKDSKNFIYYSRGSLFETKTWLRKTLSRNLISGDTAKELEASINELLKMINGYIKSIGQVNEPVGEYSIDNRSRNTDFHE